MERLWVDSLAVFWKAIIWNKGTAWPCHSKWINQIWVMHIAGDLNPSQQQRLKLPLLTSCSAPELPWYPLYILSSLRYMTLSKPFVTSLILILFFQMEYQCQYHPTIVRDKYVLILRNELKLLSGMKYLVAANIFFIYCLSDWTDVVPTSLELSSSFHFPGLEYDNGLERLSTFIGPDTVVYLFIIYSCKIYQTRASPLKL